MRGDGAGRNPLFFGAAAGPGTIKGTTKPKGDETMEQLQFLNEWGDFRLGEARRAPGVCFPRVNEAHMIFVSGGGLQGGSEHLFAGSGVGVHPGGAQESAGQI